MPYQGTFSYERGRYYKDSEREFYIGFNELTYALDIYDLTTQDYVKSISIDREGPDQIDKVEDFYVANLDEYLFQGRYGIYIIDSLGIITKKIAINFPGTDISNEDFSSINLYSEEYSRVHFDPLNNILLSQIIDVKYGFCSIKHYETPIFARIDINTKTIEKIPVFFPSIYLENYYGFHTHPYMVVVGNKLVYNFPVDPNIYVFDLDTDLTHVRGGKSQYSANMAVTLDWRYCNDPEAMLQHLMESVYFKSILYDSFRNLFYRFHLGEIDITAKSESQKFNTYNDKAQYLTVFDDSLRVIEEIPLNDRRYFLGSSFSGEKGLYVTAPNGLENYLCFKIFTFSPS